MVMFYHLTTSGADDTARSLISRALAQNWRVMVRGVDAAGLSRLDDALWQGDGFLPHGQEGGVHDARQPVLLGQGAIGNGAQALMALDGACVDAAEAAALERVFILFDGNDEAAVAAARVQWKDLKAAGLAAQYWSDADGGWQKKAG
jgi:DNA polymerase-3 subunit chi